MTNLETKQVRSNRLPYISRKVRTQRAICGLAFSCWKMAFCRPRETEHNHWTQDVTNVSTCVQITVHLSYTFACCVPNGCPNYHTRGTTHMPILNANRHEAFFSEHPDTRKTIRILHAEPKLIWKDDIVPILLCSFIVRRTRVAASLYAVLLSEIAITLECTIWRRNLFALFNTLDVVSFGCFILIWWKTTHLHISASSSFHDLLTSVRWFLPCAKILLARGI